MMHKASHVRRLVRQSVFSACFLLLFCARGWSLSIGLTMNNFTPAEENVILASRLLWESVILDPISVAIDISKSSLPGSILGMTSDYLESEAGMPMGASIDIDDREGDWFGWFVDPTPETAEEFHPTGNPSYYRADSSGPAYWALDLFSVINHEMAHALGFSANYSLFADKIVPGETPWSPRTYVGETVTATLTPAPYGTHLEDSIHPNDLMNSGMLPGVRLLPSFLDVSLLADAFGYSVVLPPDNAVPEPATFYQCSLALAVLLWGFRRRYSRH